MTSHLGLYVRVVAVALLAAASDAAPMQKGGPVESGPGSTAAARKYLEGRWTLLSFEVFPPQQPSFRVAGSGTLLYDGYGNLDVEIRVDAATAALLEHAGIQAPGGRISSSGRAAVDMQQRTLTYFFQGEPPLGAPSGPLALNRPRYWQVDGGILTLTTKDDDGHRLSVARWQKRS